MCNTPQTSDLYHSEDSAMKKACIHDGMIAIKDDAEIEDTSKKDERNSFTKFRIQYLAVYAAIMLADGLQGTHLYVLYETYGYCVSSLYALGFASGAITSLFIGALVDNLGRKRAVLMYCVLEILINYLEQYPSLVCITLSRLIGGITTNLLFTVFEAWLITEHRRRQFDEKKLENLFRDSNLVSNSAAIISGYIAHCLASTLGPVGPFVGAVGFTFVALLIVALLWCENYGNDDNKTPSLKGHMKSASDTILNTPNIAYLGLIHGLTEGTLQTFVFLWSPMLQRLSSASLPNVPGLDNDGEPAYGLIFGAYMLCGVLGNYTQPTVLKWISNLSHSFGVLNKMNASNKKADDVVGNFNNDEEGERDMVCIYILTAIYYLFGSILFLIPFLVDDQNEYSFILVLGGFLLYEYFVGAFMSSQCIIRSVHIPSDSKCSIMMMLRVLTNTAVSLGVILTIHIPMAHCFGVLSFMMITAAILQLSFVSQQQHRTKVKRE